MRIAFTLLVAAVFGAVLATSVVGADRGAKQAPSEKCYERFETDRALLRKTVRISGGAEGPPLNVSNGEAIAAAHRIFRNVPFLFRTRKEVLDILGDPATISDYGQRAAEGPNSPLVYRFDMGRGGAQYTLEFDGGKDGGQVSRIRVDGID